MIHARQNAALLLSLVITFTTTDLSRATDFTLADNFNRPNGPVGRNWQESPSDPMGKHLVVRNRRLTPSSEDCGVGMSRPLSLLNSDVVTISADLTPTNDFRHGLELLIESNGLAQNGYGIQVARSNASSPSSIHVLLNGVAVDTVQSSFNFENFLHVSVTIYPNGVVSGYVVGPSNELFHYNFPERDLSLLSGKRIAVNLECPVPSALSPTVDNLEIQVR
jgi:hypothetical protein